jgi:hypothetical protein
MRKKTKFNPELLKEELNRFKILESFDFYSGKQEEPTYEKPLITGSELDEAEGDEEETKAAVDDIAGELGVEPPTEEPTDDTEQTGEISDEMPTDEMPTDEEPALEEPAVDDSNDVEIDVTSLVTSTEEAKSAADKATQNTEMLLQKLSDLESRIASMDAISSKINDLEQEIVKRNPTPVEKLEMRSLSSYPYSVKLTDYWNDKEGAYDVMGKENEPKEYVLTQDDVDTTYSEPEIKKSFGVSPDEYEEEEI